MPLIAIEFVSGDGREERDQTSPFAGDESKAGKFWVYEQAIRVPFYAIYEVEQASVELYELVGNHYQRCELNERGHYPIPPLALELGIWLGQHMNQMLPWLRWWNNAGELLLTGEEQAEQEKQRAEQEKQRAELEKQRAEQEKQRAERMAAKLRELGIDPEAL